MKLLILKLLAASGLLLLLTGCIDQILPDKRLNPEGNVKVYAENLERKLCLRYNNLPDWAGKISCVKLVMAKPPAKSQNSDQTKIEFSQLVYDQFGQRVPDLEKEYFVIIFGKDAPQLVRTDPTITIGLNHEGGFGERTMLETGRIGALRREQSGQLVPPPGMNNQDPRTKMQLPKILPDVLPPEVVDKQRQALQEGAESENSDSTSPNNSTPSDGINDSQQPLKPSGATKTKVKDSMMKDTSTPNGRQAQAVVDVPVVSAAPEALIPLPVNTDAANTTNASEFTSSGEPASRTSRPMLLQGMAPPRSITSRVPKTTVRNLPIPDTEPELEP